MSDSDRALRSVFDRWNEDRARGQAEGLAGLLPTTPQSDAYWLGYKIGHERKVAK